MLSKATIEAKYKRAKLQATHTFLWEDVPLNLKAEIVRRIKILDGEMIAIYFYESNKYSWALTNVRLIVLDAGKETDYFYHLIKKVELRDLMSGDANKLSNDTITLVLQDNTLRNIKVESTTWHAIYEILQLLVHTSSSISGNSSNQNR